MADRYLAADELLAGAGLHWYEISNWAASPDARCQHNLLYWTGGDWWGIGPGAHSHIGGTRGGDRRPPAADAQPLAAGAGPGPARGVPTPARGRPERSMLATRPGAGGRAG